MGAAKRYLKQVRRLDSLINHLNAEKDDLMTKRVGLRGISYDQERVQTSPTGEDPNNRVTEKIIDLMARIDEEIDRYVDMRDKISKQIKTMPDTRHLDILDRRYLQFKSFYEIADELGYTYDTVRHYHLDALHSFAERYAFDIAKFERARKSSQ